MKNKGIKGYSPTMHSLKVIEHLTVPWCILVQFVSSLSQKTLQEMKYFLISRNLKHFVSEHIQQVWKKKNMPQVEMVVNSVTQ